MFRISSHRFLVLALFATLSLSGCGGGGGGGAGAGGAGLSISGVAATGAAISGGTVEARCATGTATATTSADGSYSMTVSSGEAPCVLRATDLNSNLTLHSVIEQGQSRANITPLTELIVASVSGETPSDIFSNFSQLRQSQVSETSVRQAVQRVQLLSVSLGPDADLSGIDPLKDSFQAATTIAAGDAKDKKIDALMSALASADRTIADLTQQLKSAQSNSEVTQSISSVLGSSATTLSGCSFARSGDYWVLNFAGGEPVGYSVNFETMRATRMADNVVGTISSVSGVTCSYTMRIDSLDYEFRTSRVGISAWKGATDFGIAVPMQRIKKLSDSEFAGVYPAIAFVREKRLGSRDALPFKFTIDSSGEVSGHACDMSKSIPDCEVSANDSGNDDLSCTELQNGAFSCSTSTGDAFVGIPYLVGGVAHLFMSITNLNSSPYSFGGLLVMRKAAEMRLPTAGTRISAGAGWYAGVEPRGSVVVSGTSLAATVESVDATNNSFVTSVTGSAVTASRYLNRPTSGLLYSTNASGEKAVTLGSPSGWSVSMVTSGNGYYDGWAAYIDVD
jgi:hypothetical protein